MAEELQAVSIVVVGSPMVGKSCLIASYTTNGFVVTHVPTVFDHYEALLHVDDEQVQLDIWDTSALPEHEALRELAFHKGDLFVLCFSVVDRDSFENAKNKWIDEIE